MITPREMFGALVKLALTNNYTDRAIPIEQAAEAWAEVVNDEIPHISAADLAAGVRTYAAVGDSAWPKPADLLPHLRRAHHLRTLPPKCGACDDHRQIERTEERHGRTVTVIGRCPTCHPTTRQITA